MSESICKNDYPIITHIGFDEKIVVSETLAEFKNFSIFISLFNSITNRKSCSYRFEVKCENNNRFHDESDIEYCMAVCNDKINEIKKKLGDIVDLDFGIIKVNQHDINYRNVAMQSDDGIIHKSFESEYKFKVRWEIIYNRYNNPVVQYLVTKNKLQDVLVDINSGGKYKSLDEAQAAHMENLDPFGLSDTQNDIIPGGPGPYFDIAIISTFAICWIWYGLR